MRLALSVLAGLLLAALASRPVHALAADVPPPLGERFEDHVAGISLQPPAGGTRIRQLDSGYLVRFAYPELNWDLRVKVTQLSKPVPLSQEPADNNPGGMLQMTADQSKAANASLDIQSAALNGSLWKQPIGLIVARGNAGVDRVLIQTAILPGLDPQTFYLLQFTSPGKKKSDPAGDDAHELAARAVFARTLATVELLDRAALKRDQNQRLFRTRQWLALLDDKRILSALEPDQYLRLLRDDKDVGYVHLTEQIATREEHDGVEIVARSHVVVEHPDDAPAAAPTQSAASGEIVPSAVAAKAKIDTTVAGDTTVDRLAKLFVSFDRRHEEWSITTNTGSGSLGTVTTSELGNSDKELHRVLDRQAATDAQPAADAKDPREPHVRTEDKYHLSVSNYARARTGVPVERDLPPFYLPQALGQLLPRLLPLDEPRTYMFATYVGEQHEVMSRYVDVLPEQNVVLDGQRIVAIPVRDRIGVDGSATVDYLTKDGRWLGSVNEEEKLTVLPTDRETLEPIWKKTLPPDSTGR